MKKQWNFYIKLKERMKFLFILININTMGNTMIKERHNITPRSLDIQGKYDSPNKVQGYLPSTKSKENINLPINSGELAANISRETEMLIKNDSSSEDSRHNDKNKKSYYIHNILKKYPFDKYKYDMAEPMDTVFLFTKYILRKKDCILIYNETPLFSKVFKTYKNVINKKKNFFFLDIETIAEKTFKSNKILLIAGSKTPTNLKEDLKNPFSIFNTGGRTDLKNPFSIFNTYPMTLVNTEFKNEMYYNNIDNNVENARLYVINIINSNKEKKTVIYIDTVMESIIQNIFKKKNISNISPTGDLKNLIDYYKKSINTTSTYDIISDMLLKAFCQYHKSMNKTEVFNYLEEIGEYALNENKNIIINYLLNENK